MRVAITGHTQGIGQAIFRWYVSRGHTVVGFSRSTGHDLSLPGTITNIIESAADADLFVNNAFSEMAQVYLLYGFYDRWKDCPKTILTIGSNTGDVTKNYRHLYAVCKLALDKTVEQLQNTQSRCRILNLRPGYVDTNAVKHVTAKKMTPTYIAEVAGWMIAQKSLIRTLTVTP